MAGQIEWKGLKFPYYGHYKDYEKAWYMISEAFYIHRLISWKIYNLALNKIKRVENESWMFEGGVSNVMLFKW